MKRKNIFTFTTKAIVSMALVVFTACDRDDADLGLPYVDGDQLSFGQLEQVPIRTYTVPFDSVRSNNPTSGIGLVGGYTDPVFGRTEARVASHLIPSGVPSFGTNPVCDSAFLFIPYTLTESAWYGDTLAPFDIQVHTLRDFLSRDSNYYSNHVFALDQIIADAQVELLPRTKIDFEHVTTPRAIIKIPIDPTFINDVIFPLESTNAFETTENFINQFYGIQLSGESTNEAIAGLLMPSSDTKLKMYFRNDEGDTADYDLKMGTAGAFVNTFEHDYSMSPFDLNNQNTADGEMITYSQAMGGVVTAIEIPDLSDYQDSAWLLNRAELLLPVREGSVLNYRLPQRMQLVQDDADGRRVIFDYLVEGTVAVGGGLTTGDLRDHKYRFVLTRQMQRYLSQQDTLSRLLIVPDLSSSDQARAVLNGNLSTFKPGELKLYYTRTQ